ncbi:hypothetical protein IA868_00345 [Listeria welshimeri]|uniref:hypothetical protein n=1 Tax=Listeria welshimeri TaxID=1643 RepID=UPI00188998C3|nr:hypothetical protein [Listeria welshimeri]MBF2471609.1 hypothetical protein [Listeria welshimeri]
MERGVYTPSLNKLLEICNILNVTLNDFLLESRDFDDYKKENFETLDSNIFDMTQTMKIVEEERANALLAKQQGKEKEECQYLDHIIGMFAWTNTIGRLPIFFIIKNYKKILPLSPKIL